jgi:hypothetical protein
MCRDVSIYVVITFFSHLFASLNYVRHCSTSLKNIADCGMAWKDMEWQLHRADFWLKSCMAHGVSWQMHVELTWVDINLESLKLVATHCHPLSRCDFFEALFIRWLRKVVPERSVVPHRDGTAHILTSERFKVQKLCQWTYMVDRAHLQLCRIVCPWVRCPKPADWPSGFVQPEAATMAGVSPADLVFTVVAHTMLPGRHGLPAFLRCNLSSDEVCAVIRYNAPLKHPYGHAVDQGTRGVWAGKMPCLALHASMR